MDSHGVAKSRTCSNLSAFSTVTTVQIYFLRPVQTLESDIHENTFEADEIPSVLNSWSRSPYDGIYGNCHLAVNGKIQEPRSNAQLLFFWTPNVDLFAPEARSQKPFVYPTRCSILKKYVFLFHKEIHV